MSENAPELNAKQAAARQAALERTDTLVQALKGSPEKMREAIKDAVGTMLAIRIERGELTARQREVRESLEARFGINRNALDAAMQYADLSETKQAGWDATFMAARQALECPVQFGLFHEEEEKEPTLAVVG